MEDHTYKNIWGTLIGFNGIVKKNGVYEKRVNRGRFGGKWTNIQFFHVLIFMHLIKCLSKEEVLIGGHSCPVI